MLSMNHISMRFGAKILFEDVSCTFLAGRRYAITGSNGAGKPTLMNILTGEIEPSKGSVTRPKTFQAAYQEQTPTEGLLRMQPPPPPANPPKSFPVRI